MKKYYTECGNNLHKPWAKAYFINEELIINNKLTEKLPDIQSKDDLLIISHNIINKEFLPNKVGVLGLRCDGIISLEGVGKSYFKEVVNFYINVNLQNSILGLYSVDCNNVELSEFFFTRYKRDGNFKRHEYLTKGDFLALENIINEEINNKKLEDRDVFEMLDKLLFYKNDRLKKFAKL